MPSNIEIKARVQDPERLTSLVQRLSGQKGELLIQEDTFFVVPHGRLKLRTFPSKPAQLIAYHRTDQAGPKLSDYAISEISQPHSLKDALKSTLGLLGVVKKHRTLFLIGQTRVHLDEVEGLGHFVELEVVLRPEQSTSQGAEIASKLMRELEIPPAALCETAYLDLLKLSRFYEKS